MVVCWFVLYNVRCFKMKELQVRGKRCRTQLTLEPRVRPFPPTLTSTFSTSTSSPQHSLNYSKSRSWRQPRTQAILPPQCPICALTARMAPTLLHSHSRLQVLSGQVIFSPFLAPLPGQPFALSHLSDHFWPFLPPSLVSSF